MPRLREATWVSYAAPEGEYWTNPPEPETWLHRRDRNGFVWSRHVRGKDWMTLSEAATYLQINPATAWSWARTGKLKAKRRGRVRMVRFTDVYDLGAARGIGQRIVLVEDNSIRLRAYPAKPTPASGPSRRGE
jgi:hypothetical protein